MLVLPLLLLMVAGCDENLKPAMLALQQNNPSQALTLLEPLSSRCTQSSAFYEILGLANELSGNKTAAEQALTTAVKLNSKSARLLTELGATFLRNGKPAAASKILDQALTIDPSSMVTLKYAVGAAVGSHNWSSAAALFRQMNIENDSRTLQQDPILTLWLAQTLIETKQQDRIDASLSPLRASMPPGLLFSLGTLFAQHGFYKRAIDYFKQIPAQAADDALYFNLGLSYSHLQQFDDARRCYFEAIDCHPDHVEAYLHIGLDYITSGQPRLGIPWVYKAHGLAPGRQDIAYALTEQLIALEYFDTAKHVLTQAFEKAPRDPFLLVADGDLQRAHGDSAGAITSYRQALAEKAGFTAALVGLARADSSAGKESDAEGLLDTALSHDPQDPIANAELGLLEEHKGNWKAAVQHLGRAWAQDRSNRDIALHLARAYQQEGRPQDALHLLESISTEMSESSAFHFQLAQLYTVLHRSAEALAERDVVTRIQANKQGALHFENPGTYVH